MSAITVENLFNDAKGNYAVVTNITGATAFLGGKTQTIELDSALPALANAKAGTRVYFDAEGAAIAEQPKATAAPKGPQPSGSAGCDFDKARAATLA